MTLSDDSLRAAWPQPGELPDNLFHFDITAQDPKTHARCGVFHTAHGDVPTPIFMPVGTKATVKGLMPSQVADLGAKIILNNTYHLAMRPGADLVAEMGGVHKFMRWNGPILTDSGGFQVFSHNEFMKLTNEGVSFRAIEYDGARIRWTPEDNMAIAEKLGSDICMQLDQCPATRPRRPTWRAPSSSPACGASAVGTPTRALTRRSLASSRVACTWTCA